MLTEMLFMTRNRPIWYVCWNCDSVRDAKPIAVPVAATFAAAVSTCTAASAWRWRASRTLASPSSAMNAASSSSSADASALARKSTYRDAK